MWQYKKTDEYPKRQGWYEKKGYRDEVVASLSNLDTYFKALEAGAKPLQITFGFVMPN